MNPFVSKGSNFFSLLGWWKRNYDSNSMRECWRSDNPVRRIQTHVQSEDTHKLSIKWSLRLILCVCNSQWAIRQRRIESLINCLGFFLLHEKSLFVSRFKCALRAIYKIEYIIGCAVPCRSYGSRLNSAKHFFLLLLSNLFSIVIAANANDWLNNHESEWLQLLLIIIYTNIE